MIKDFIKEKERITFREFMERALYAPGAGYYSSPKIGFQGADFYTGPEMTPLFGELLAIQAEQIGNLPENQDVFTIIEIGAGKGTLALHMLNFLKKVNPGLFSRLTYIIIEKSPAMISSQKALLSKFGNIQWKGLEDLQEINGLIISNEFFDALPVHRIKVKDKSIMEIYLRLDEAGENIIEELAPPSRAEIISYFDMLEIQFPNSYPDGYETEVNLEAVEYIKKLGQVLKRGYVITIDYGYPATEYYSIERHRGTILAYHQHKSSENLYEHVGQQDITAHLNFSAISRAGTSSGLESIGFSNQMNFFTSLAASSGYHSEEELAGIKDFIDPCGMGKTFNILVQQKAIEKNHTLHCLRFKGLGRDRL